MVDLVFLLIGSVLIGFGINWQVGLGVFVIAFGLRQLLVSLLNDLFANIVNNLRTIYNKLE